jgi:hypothetical protein
MRNPRKVYPIDPGVIAVCERHIIRGRDMKWKHSQILTIPVVLAVSAASCNDAGIPQDPVEAVVESTDDLSVIHLASSLRQMALDERDTEFLPRRLQLGRTSRTAFGRVADVVGMDDGRFAVLDRMESRVIIFDSVGAVVSSFGRSGEGPGEFVAPWALGYSSGMFVVWEGNVMRTFTLMTEDGRVHDIRTNPIEGDWIRHIFRQPSKHFDDGQHGPEEITHRLRSDPAQRGWIQIVQQDERPLLQDRADSIRPRSHVVRFHHAGDAVDTLAVLDGPLTYRERSIPKGFVREYAQPTFASRPVVAVGDQWVAIGTGDSASVRVAFSNGQRPLSIRWPMTGEEVTLQDKRNHIEWLIENGIATSEEFAGVYRASSPSRIEQEIAAGIDREYWPAVVPEITAMWGGGRCLLLAGFASDDTPFGESSRMVLVNVYDPEELQAIRIPRGRRVRDVAGTNLFALFKTDRGEWLVESYELPFSCDAGR